MWTDSHCHLHLCGDSGTPSALAERARAAGVERIVTIGIDVASSKASCEIASDNALNFTAGVHPNAAKDWSDGVMEDLESLFADRRCVGVGETGLDFFREAAPRADQVKAFAAHIVASKRFDKALVIHTRDSAGEAIEMLEVEEPPARLVFHCWSGSPTELRRALDLGAFISFAGNVSFKNASELQDLARSVPSDRLLVETDSPFLTPVPLRGRPNEPRNVVHVGEAIARVRGEPADEVARLTSANARAVFQLDP